MEAYILDSLYRRVQVVDRFKSLVWTERYKQSGDFVMTLYSTLENRNRFVPGTCLSCNESFYVMTVDTIEDTTDDQGMSTLTLTGRSLEGVMDNRVARGIMDDLTAVPKWVLTGTPTEIARQMFHDICVTGILDPGDIIPFVIEGTIFPEDTIAEPVDEIVYELDPTTLYLGMKDLCNQFDIGFRLVRNFDTSELYFNVYVGSDRTSSQTALPAVIFSPNLENLRNTTELVSVANYKNVAYVFSPVGFEVVYLLDVDPLISGFDRRVLLVKADDITDVDPAVATAKMIRRGKEELAKNRRFVGFDGEVSQNSKYKYNRDYYLGDLVERQNGLGGTSTMRVVEQIFVSDEQGDRSYPTLAISQYITAGSWLAWDYNQVWEDLGSEVWADQP